MPKRYDTNPRRVGIDVYVTRPIALYLVLIRRDVKKSDERQKTKKQNFFIERKKNICDK